MTYAWIPKKSRNTSEQPACHDLLIVLRYAMKSRVIYLYWLSRRNSIYLFIAIFILCYSCSPSTYGRALNCQNLYVEMGGKVSLYGKGFLCCHVRRSSYPTVDFCDYENFCSMSIFRTYVHARTRGTENCHSPPMSRFSVWWAHECASARTCANTCGTLNRRWPYPVHA